MKSVFLLAGLVWLAGAGVNGQNAHQSLRSGDDDYLKEHYETAEKKYGLAKQAEPTNPNTTYNLGCAQYQQSKYADAEKSFEQAAAGNQPAANKANALYNLGNARLQQRKFNEAIEAYENSLRLQPGDAAAKQNLQMAKQKLEEKQKQEQKQKQNQQENQEQNKGQQPPQEQPQQPNKQPGQPDQKPGQQPQPPQPPSPGGDKQNQDPSSGAPTEPGKMTKQEAQRLLETTIGPEDRKSARKYRANVRKTLPKDQKKDW